MMLYGEILLWSTLSALWSYTSYMSLTLATSSLAHWPSLRSHYLLFSSSINFSLSTSLVLYSLARFLKFKRNYLVSSFYRSLFSYSIRAMACSLANTCLTISLSWSFSYYLWYRLVSFYCSLLIAIPYSYVHKLEPLEQTICRVHNLESSSYSFHLLCSTLHATSTSHTLNV